jgi:hypothetical protein
MNTPINATAEHERNNQTDELTEAELAPVSGGGIFSGVRQALGLGSGGPGIGGAVSATSTNTN